MLQEDVFSCQKQKNIVNYTIFALGKQPKNCKKSPKKCPKWTSETHLGILASFFPIQNGPKSPKIPFLDVLKFRHPKIVQKLRKHHQYLDSVRNLERPPPPVAGKNTYNVAHRLSAHFFHIHVIQIPQRAVCMTLHPKKTQTAFAQNSCTSWLQSTKQVSATNSLNQCLDRFIDFK